MKCVKFESQGCTIDAFPVFPGGGPRVVIEINSFYEDETKPQFVSLHFDEAKEFVSELSKLLKRVAEEAEKQKGGDK